MNDYNVNRVWGVTARVWEAVEQVEQVEAVDDDNFEEVDEPD